MCVRLLHGKNKHNNTKKKIEQSILQQDVDMQCIICLCFFLLPQFIYWSPSFRCVPLHVCYATGPDKHASSPHQNSTERYRTAPGVDFPVNPVALAVHKTRAVRERTRHVITLPTSTQSVSFLRSNSGGGRRGRHSSIWNSVVLLFTCGTTDNTILQVECNFVINGGCCILSVRLWRRPGDRMGL